MRPTASDPDKSSVPEFVQKFLNNVNFLLYSLIEDVARDLQ